MYLENRVNKIFDNVFKDGDLKCVITVFTNTNVDMSTHYSIDKPLPKEAYNNKFVPYMPNKLPTNINNLGELYKWCLKCNYDLRTIPYDGNLDNFWDDLWKN
mgnify:CR=1 FL=1